VGAADESGQGADAAIDANERVTFTVPELQF
jgi:hypothetical protein